ncbi:hypothetical protein L593_12475 [Salinarchaeum sp. Harcht-Bsk1]|uniref:SRPBCC family protein n=1 Tax=Salinarchaeum sp. Harcht-Bsk1 TaxID=1333523 RepID=UPI0003422B26|nr:SRPBCC family protein [Salinarchaeum sp. Harcht-Bsk1]AGN02434.1 hypothetical protein L593_12475 [Salinarchaeum sp. Harcht-Bsk1]
MNYDLGLVRTDRGRRIELGREVPVSAAAAWTVLSEVAYWNAWGPPVTDVEYPDERVSPQTSGHVRVFGLFWVPFRIETVDGMEWTWSVRGMTPPADGHGVEDLGDGHSRVFLQLPLWAPWYLLVCAVALRRLGKVARQEGSRH